MASNRVASASIGVLVVTAAAIALGVLLAGPGPGEAGAQVPPGDAGRPRAGREIWLQDCAICHGTRGRGSFQGPDVTGAGAAGVDFMVRTGRMPLPFRSSSVRGVDQLGAGGDTPRSEPAYSAVEIRRLVRYSSRILAGPPVPDVGDVADADLARGGELFRAQCAACHQMAGSGGALAYGTTAPPLRSSTPVEVVEAMRLGPGSMPVFGPDVVDARQARDVAAYVRELHDPRDRGGIALWHLGPVPEGLVAWLVGIAGVVAWCRWLGTRDPVGPGDGADEEAGVPPDGEGTGAVDEVTAGGGR